jgi:hypothetical protein
MENDGGSFARRSDKFKEAEIDDPAACHKGKTIRVGGTVTLKNGEPRIEVIPSKSRSSRSRAVAEAQGTWMVRPYTRKRRPPC